CSCLEVVARKDCISMIRAGKSGPNDPQQVNLHGTNYPCLFCGLRCAAQQGSESDQPRVTLTILDANTMDREGLYLFTNASSPLPLQNRKMLILPRIIPRSSLRKQAELLMRHGVYKKAVP